MTLQIVVVDDGSADGTAQRAQALGDSRILVVRHERSLGLAGARNAGIRAATGEWIAFLDDDDLWSETKLLSQLRAARRDEADWCYAGAAFVDERGRLLGLADPPDPLAVVRLLRGVNVIPAGASNVLVRAALLDRVGEFDERLSHFADWDLWIRLAAAARPAVVDEPLLAYVQHPGNMRLTDSEGLVRELDHLDAKHGLAGRRRAGARGDAAMDRGEPMANRAPGRRHHHVHPAPGLGSHAGGHRQRSPGCSCRCGGSASPG